MGEPGYHGGPAWRTGSPRIRQTTMSKGDASVTQPTANAARDPHSSCASASHPRGRPCDCRRRCSYCCCHCCCLCCHCCYCWGWFHRQFHLRAVVVPRCRHGRGCGQQRVFQFPAPAVDSALRCLVPQPVKMRGLRAVGAGVAVQAVPSLLQSRLQLVRCGKSALIGLHGMYESHSSPRNTYLAEPVRTYGLQGVYQV